MVVAMCPDELKWRASNVLRLFNVLDDIDDPAVPIIAATLVTVELFDEADGSELTVISPVTLDQVGVTNEWRKSVEVIAGNGFALTQRIRLDYIFDGGAGLQGFFQSKAVVVPAS